MQTRSLFKAMSFPLKNSNSTFIVTLGVSNVSMMKHHEQY